MKTSFLDKLKIALLRFPLTVIFSLVLTVLVNLSVFKVEAVDTQWIISSGLALLVSFFVTLLLENRVKTIYSFLINIVSIGLVFFLISLMPIPLTKADLTVIFTLYFTFGLGVFVAPFIFSKKSSLRFWNYAEHTFSQFVISYFFALVIVAGIDLALLSLSQLFDIDVPSKIYAVVFSTSMLLFAPIYLMSSMGKSNEWIERSKVEFSKFYKILGLYILLPILLAYMVVLYAYLGKVVITWELPKGWVSWLVSILTLGGFLILSLLFPLYKLYTKKNKGKTTFIQLFYLLFPIVLLPLLVFMFVGIYRRFEDYGITINRLYLIILNVWFIAVTLYLIITQYKNIKNIWISLTIIAFVASFNVVPYIKYSMTSELKTLLYQANYGKKEIKKLDKEKQIRVVALLDYIHSTFSANEVLKITKSMGKKATKETVIKTLIDKENIDINTYINTVNRNYYYQYNLKKNKIDISNSQYRLFIYLKKDYHKKEIYKNDKINIFWKNRSIVIEYLDNKTQQVMSLKGFYDKRTSIDYNNEDLDKYLIHRTDDYLLIINDISGNTNEEEAIRLIGNLFLK